MNILHEAISTIPSPHAAAALSEAAGKSFLILAAAIPLTVLCRKCCAATRHFLWLAVLASLLALPAATVVAPRWNSPAWADKILRQDTAQLAANAAPGLVTGRAAAANNGKSSTLARAASAAQPAPRAVKPISWRALVWLGWLLGVALTMLVFIEQQWRLRRIERAARPVTDPELLESLASVLRELGLRPNVRLLEIDQPLMPMTWGCWRPAALVPAGAANWEPERLRLILRHELAHVRRGDCFTQGLAAIVCALYWFNPLAWIAAARMRVEREQACDDLVVSLGKTRPSEYAGHLLEIARQWSAAPGAALPVAKRSGLEQRLRALLDGGSRHGEMTRRAALGIVGSLAVCLIALAGWRVAAADSDTEALRAQLISQVRSFSALKEKQAERLAADAGEQISPEFKNFFDESMRGDGPAVTNRFAYYQKHHRQYSHTEENDPSLDTSYWSTVLEVELAYESVLADEPQYDQEFEREIIQSIPAGSIYFGGTDPGRGLITAFSRSHPEGDPFFTLTQNALADGTYLEYLRRMYGGKLSLLSEEDSQKAFEDYIADARTRTKENKLKPNEHVTVDEHGGVQATGQVAVMAINAGLARIVFDRNPEREFYIEESFPLDWMYPYLEPHGLIMKINRAPLAGLTAETVQKDQEYWQPRIQEMIGDWLRPETPLQSVIEFADKIYAQHDLAGFTGNPRFVQNVNAQKIFSKLRDAQAGLYAWRLGAMTNFPTPAEYLAPEGAARQLLSDAADLAFRQAIALCPYSPEAVTRYADFLLAQGRKEDALAVLELGVRQQGAHPSKNADDMTLTVDKLKALKGP